MATSVHPASVSRPRGSAGVRASEAPRESLRCQCTATFECAPRTVEASIDHIARQSRVSLAEGAALMDFRKKRLEKATNPDCGDRVLSPRALIQFMRAFESVLPLQLLCAEMGGVFVPLPDAATTDEHVYAAILKQVEEVGQASERIRRALSPESEGGTAFTPAEAEACARELDEVAAAAMTAKAIVFARVTAKPVMARMGLEPAASARRQA